MHRGRTGKRGIARVVALAVLLGSAGVSPHLSGQELTPEERAVARWVDEHQEEAVALLERLVNINSGTMNPEGIRRVAEVLRPELEAMGFDVDWIELPPETNRAGHLFARRRGERGKSVLLIGHLDTVFEEDHPFQRFTREGDTAHGPGVSDMKAGDVAIVFALKALHSVGALDGLDITVAFIGDEESPGEPLDVVREDLVEAAKRVDVALGFEGAVRDARGEYATIARRSSTGWKLEVEGRQAHSSGIFSPSTGAGAIFEAARILNAFYDEVRGEEYLTFNAGVILGGTEVRFQEEESRGTAFGKTNVVPHRVVVSGGIRTISQEQLERARTQMTEIVRNHLPGTSAGVSFSDGYPPMAPTEGNRALLEMYSEVSEDLGLGEIQALDPGRRGAADISFAAPWAGASLAGIGVHGSGAHGPEERVDLTSISPAVKRAALLLYRLGRGQGNF